MAVDGIMLEAELSFENIRERFGTFSYGQHLPPKVNPVLKLNITIERQGQPHRKPVIATHVVLESEENPNRLMANDRSRICRGASKALQATLSTATSRA